MVNAAQHDFRPAEGGNLFSAMIYEIPAFVTDDVPAGVPLPDPAMDNTVTTDNTGAARTNAVAGAVGQ
jgi:hypothetical protein